MSSDIQRYSSEAYNLLSEENQKLEKELAELKEWKKQASVILNDVWYWDTCPQNFKTIIEGLLPKAKQEGS